MNDFLCRAKPNPGLRPAIRNDVSEELEAGRLSAPNLRSAVESAHDVRSSASSVLTSKLA